MLNVELIKSAMTQLGLTGTDVAKACGVSKEAVSNWLNGESIPRPSKITALSTALKIATEELFVPDPSEPPSPVIAFRTRMNRAPSLEIQEVGEEVGRHLRQLLPFIGAQFSPRQIVNPKVDERLIEENAKAIRAELKLGATEAVTHGHLLQVLKIGVVTK